MAYMTDSGKLQTLLGASAFSGNFRLCADPGDLNDSSFLGLVWLSGFVPGTLPTGSYSLQVGFCWTDVQFT